MQVSKEIALRHLKALITSYVCFVLSITCIAQSTPSGLTALQSAYARDIGHPLDGRMRYEGPGLRAAYLTPIFPSSHAANLLALRNGDLLCFWFSGNWEGESGVSIVVSRLAAGSSQWSIPVVVDRHVDESYQNPVGFQAPDGTVWLLHTTQPAGKGEAQSRVLVLRSKDNGATWSAPAVLFDTQGSYIRNPMLIMPGGNWMLPMYFTSEGSGNAKTDRSAMAISANQGKDWRICDIPGSNGEVQPSIFYDPVKGYVALLRSRRADHIYRSVSQDGCHWTLPIATDLPNNNASIQALRLPDGNVLLAFNNTSAQIMDGKRRTGPRKPLSLALSSDDGETWHPLRDLETGRPGVTDMRKVPGREEYSYPALALGHDGNIYIAYTFRRETIKVVSFHLDEVDKSDGAFFLDPENYRHYFTEFSHQEAEATGHVDPDPWPWIKTNVPWFDSSDKDFEEMYYFRWFAFAKHVVSTPHGFVITEFLPHVNWGGYYNTIVDAAPFHLYEARWLRDPRIAGDDARFWMSADAAPRNYSVALADAISAVILATGNMRLGTDLLPAMEANYRAWETTHQDSNGLFWSIDTRDAMEHSISGDGYRPTLNSYMYADAAAIAALAKKAGDSATASEFAAKAEAQRQHIEKYLWNPSDQFYEVLSTARDSGIRKEKRFVDPSTVLQFSDVRELIGYIPWDYNIPSPDRAVAWKQLFDPHGFAGKYGPTTAERRSPRFRYKNSDKCQWNGPSWPFATTQALIGLANLENNQQQDYVTREDYYRLFQEYVLSQHLRLPDGRIIPWIDEDLDADTGEWIARDILARRHSPEAGRGAYYNHSGFADPLITGLLGLRPSADDTIVLHPLLPPGAWSYFALDGLPWHGHLLTIVYDPTGEHYHHGRGFLLLVDGQQRASRVDLGPLEYRLSEQR